MATFLDRVLQTVDPAEEGQPNTETISTHDLFAFFRLYLHAGLLRANRVQWLNLGRDTFDLNTAQRTRLGEWLDSIDGGKEIHLFEAAMMGGQFDKMIEDGTQMLTRQEVKDVIGIINE
jgi:hypothetical protein